MSEDNKRNIADEILQGLQELSTSVEKSTEVNTKICKVCGLPKTRIEKGKYPKGTIKIYTNEFDKKWNGLCCPDCNKTRVKNVMRAGRLGKSSDDNV